MNIMMYGFGSAVKNLNESEIQRKADDGSIKAAKLLKIIDEPVRFINTIQLTATFMAVITGYVQSDIFIHKLSSTFVSAFGNLLSNTAYTVVSAMIVIFCILIILLSFGVVVPKRLGLKYSEGFSYFFVNIITFIVIILRPITGIINIISNIVLRILGIDPKEEWDNVTEDEIISIVNEGHEQGILEEREAEMISNIMELDDKDAGDIMTHRKNIVAVDGNWTLKETVEFMLNENNSRFPVFIDDIDNIVAILHLRDALECFHKEDKAEWLIKDIKPILREAIFIPETKNIDALFKEMQYEKIHMEIVLDEYGQTAGIVAMEDILEEIVGNILDEYDVEDNNIVKHADHVYLVKGMTPLEQIEDELGVAFEDNDYDTLNGYLIARLDRIPEEGDKPIVVCDKYTYEVLAIENKMISLVKLTVRDSEN